MVSNCKCLACDHESTGIRVNRIKDGSIVVFLPSGGPSFPSMPYLVPAEKVGVCTKRLGEIVGYISPEKAWDMSHEELVDSLLEKQTVASHAISVAIQFGGIEAEKEIEQRIEKDLCKHESMKPLVTLEGSAWDQHPRMRVDGFECLNENCRTVLTVDQMKEAGVKNAILVGQAG